MAMRMVLAAGLLTGLVGGCANDRGGGGATCEPAGGSVADDAALGGIAYQVTGGLTGQGDGTSLQIAADGTFTRQTLQRGAEQGQLDRPTLDDLASKARAARLPTLCPIYQGDLVDEFAYEVSVQLDASTYTVTTGESATPPDRLQVLIRALQAIAERPLS